MKKIRKAYKLCKLLIRLWVIYNETLKVKLNSQEEKCVNIEKLNA